MHRDGTGRSCRARAQVLTDLDAAQLCLDVYAGSEGFDDFLMPEADDGICFGIKRSVDVDDVVFRGSANLHDWLADLSAAPHQFTNHPKFGPVHEGMFTGMDSAFAKIRPLLRIGTRTRVYGHSLGGARAVYLIAMLIDVGFAPDQIDGVVFGCPKPGYQKLAEFVAPVEIRSYRNGQPNTISHDYVTDVPFTLPMFPFVRVRPMIDTTCVPEPNDSLGVFAWHRMAYYLRALSSSASGT